MTDDPAIYTKPSVVTVEDGGVHMDGPDGVDVNLTPDAAFETSQRLLDAAMKAEGERHLKDLPHLGDDATH